MSVKSNQINMDSSVNLCTCKKTRTPVISSFENLPELLGFSSTLSLGALTDVGRLGCSYVFSHPRTFSKILQVLLQYYIFFSYQVYDNSVESKNDRRLLLLKIKLI